MSPSLRKLLLATHLTVSVGWIGAAAAYLAIGLAAGSSTSPETVRGAWIAMELIGWYAIVPLAAAALVTGVVMAVGTRWGLFRHYWVIFSLVLTTFALVVLVLHMPTVSYTADKARSASPARLETLGGDVVHPTIGLVILVAILILNIYKPRGVTAYGRRQATERPEPATVG